jgi:hypothetical protein
VAALGDPNGSIDAAAELDGSDESLRRVYLPEDMKLHPCAVPRPDGSIVGEGCPSALVVFGPYVSVPANADVKLRFDIESATGLLFASDVLSDRAKQFHGSLDEQFLLPKEKRTISYRVRIFDAARTLETRIGIRSDEPASFTISNLKVSIQ